MPSYTQIISETIYVLVEDRVVRTGLLVYYDPLLYSDISGSTLTSLNTVNDVVPAEDAITALTLPDHINANLMDLEITSS